MKGKQLTFYQGIFLSTLPVRGATIADYMGIPTKVISIHAPREGSDPGNRCRKRRFHSISIHAPREGSDPFQASVLLGAKDFYPRSP